MEKKPRRIPYGTMNWAEIVRECHFVDTGWVAPVETAVEVYGNADYNWFDVKCGR